MKVCLWVQRVVVSVLLWGVHLGLVDRGGETRSHHLFYGLETMNIVSLHGRNDLTMGLIFRYDFGNVLGTQNRPTYGCGHNGWESLPSFCNGLGTIYIASSRGRTFLILLLEI